MKYKAICFDIDGTLYPIGVMNRRIFRLSAVHPGFGMQYRRARREFRRHQGSFRKEIPFRWREAAIIQTGTGAEPEEDFSEEVYRQRYGKTYDRLDRWAYRKMDRFYERTEPFEATGIGRGSGGANDGTLTLGEGVSILVSSDNVEWTAYDGETRQKYMKTE